MRAPGAPVFDFHAFGYRRPASDAAGAETGERGHEGQDDTVRGAASRPAVWRCASSAAANRSSGRSGLGKRAPDETSVVEQAPLELPPDFDLRPPVPGAERPQERAAGAQAREIVVGAAAAEDSAPVGGAGERSLLARAGADEADPAIRDVLKPARARSSSPPTPASSRT